MPYNNALQSTTSKESQLTPSRLNHNNLNNRSPIPGSHILEQTECAHECRVLVNHFYQYYTHDTNRVENRVDHHTLQHDLDRLIQNVKTLRNFLDTTPTSTPKLINTIITHLVLFVNRHLYSLPVTDNAKRQLQKQVKAFIAEDKAIQGNDPNLAQAFSKNDWMAHDERTAERYLALLTKFCYSLFETMKQPNEKGEERTLRASFIVAFIDMLGLSEVVKPLDLPPSTLDSVQVNKHFGSLTIRNNYMILKMFKDVYEHYPEHHPEQHSECYHVPDIRIDQLDRYITLCDRLVDVKHFLMNSGLRPHDDAYSTAMNEINTIFGELDDAYATMTYYIGPINDISNAIFDYMYIAGQQGDSVAQHFMKKENFALDKKEPFYALDTHFKLLTSLGQSITDWQPAAPTPETKRLLTQLKKDWGAHLNTLNTLYEDHEYFPTFTEAFYWYYAHNDQLNKLLLNLSTLETQFKNIQQYQSNAVCDDDLIALFNDAQISHSGSNKNKHRTHATKKKEKKGKKRSKTHKKHETQQADQNRHAPGETKEEKRAKAWRSADMRSERSPLLHQMEVAPELDEWLVVSKKEKRRGMLENVTQLSDQRYSIETSFITHSGECQTTLISDRATPELNRLARKTWSPRVLHRKQHPSIDNMLYHYHKHCCIGVSPSNRITIEQYCTLAEAMFLETEKRVQFHKNSLEETLTTATENPVYGAYSPLTAEGIRCHTLYRRDPNNPKRPISFTLDWLMKNRPDIACADITLG